MNAIDIANGIVFQKLHIKNDSFDSRLIAQKKIYLLQALGTELGYNYNWYIRGPYSPSLSNYIYSNIDLLESYNFGAQKLSEQTEKNIAVVNGLEDSKLQSLTVSNWYELLASLAFLKKNKASWQINDNQLTQTLRKYKPQFSEDECTAANQALVNLRLFSYE